MWVVVCTLRPMRKHLSVYRDAVVGEVPWLIQGSRQLTVMETKADGMMECMDVFDLHRVV